MAKLQNDFISTEARTYRWHIGRVLASSFSGFLAGAIIMAIIFLAFFHVSLK